MEVRVVGNLHAVWTLFFQHSLYFSLSQCIWLLFTFSNVAIFTNIDGMSSMPRPSQQRKEVTTLKQVLWTSSHWKQQLLSILSVLPQRLLHSSFKGSQRQHYWTLAQYLILKSQNDSDIPVKPHWFWVLWWFGVHHDNSLEWQYSGWENLLVFFIWRNQAVKLRNDWGRFLSGFKLHLANFSYFFFQLKAGHKNILGNLHKVCPLVGVGILNITWPLFLPDTPCTIFKVSVMEGLKSNEGCQRVCLKSRGIKTLVASQCKDQT